MTEAEFWEQVGRSEGAEQEFKETLIRSARLQDSVVAFANRRGGDIYVGIQNAPRRVVGISWGEAEEERVQEVARMTHPPIGLSTTVLAVAGLQVGKIRVEGAPSGWVQTSDGRLLVRAGPTNRTLVGEELARFVRERSAEPVEDTGLRDISLGDLRQDAVRDFLRRRLHRQRINPELELRNLGFIDPHGRVRLATVLLFGREPQRDRRRFGIEVLRFDGSVDDQPRTLRDRVQLTGDLPTLVEEADRMIYDEMRRDAVIRGLVREEVPEFPPIAIREALLNAVGHRDYSLSGSSVQVRLFADGIEIESPGTLAGWVTVDNLLEAQFSRNQRIMDAFEVLRLVEEAGTGVDKMYAAMADALLDPPEFEERDQSFLVRFRGRTVFSAEDRIWVSRFADFELSPDAKVALVFAKRQGAIRNPELRALRSLDALESRDVLQDLVSRGLLVKVGASRGTRYSLGEMALQPQTAATSSEQVQAVVAHAGRVGSIANKDVRGLLGVDSSHARAILEAAVREQLLRPVGERRGRRYLPTESEPGQQSPLFSPK
jgi:ATP-dependent DNA helicase RecG